MQALRMPFRNFKCGQGLKRTENNYTIKKTFQLQFYKRN